jgi:cytochrome oxidase Cu insertion factor (SCO1/SenC/PrrC family)
MLEQTVATAKESQMSTQDSSAVAVARAHVDAWSSREYDKARTRLAPDVHVVSISVDPEAPEIDLSGVDAYMEGLVQFGNAVLPGTTRVETSVGDDTRALLRVTSRIKFGPDAPEMTLHAARLYLLDAQQKIKDELVTFFVAPQ